MVVEGTVLVAKMGATVAAATGVTVLKMGFYTQKYTHFRFLVIKHNIINTLAMRNPYVNAFSNNSFYTSFSNDDFFKKKENYIH